MRNKDPYGGGIRTVTSNPSRAQSISATYRMNADRYILRWTIQRHEAEHPLGHNRKETTVALENIAGIGNCPASLSGDIQYSAEFIADTVINKRRKTRQVPGVMGQGMDLVPFQGSRQTHSRQRPIKVTAVAG
jgi:hypothetical protein